MKELTYNNINDFIHIFLKTGVTYIEVKKRSLRQTLNNNEYYIKNVIRNNAYIELKNSYETHQI